MVGFPPGTLLRRYEAGACESVWAEMMELGPAVREPQYFDEAWAVARETMRRVRHNLMLIIPRLDGLGYRFWNGKQGRPHGPPRKLIFGGKVIEGHPLDVLLAAMFEAALKTPPAEVTPVMMEQLHNIYRMAIFPYQDTARLAHGERLPLDAQASALFDQGKKIPPGQVTHALLAQLHNIHRPAIDQAIERWKERQRLAAPVEKPPETVDHLRDKKVFRPSARKDVAFVKKMEKKGVFLPLALRAWIEEVGDVNLAGAHPRLCFWEDGSFPGIYADPLMVVPSLFLWEMEDWLREQEDGGGRAPLDALLGWDAKAKAGLAVEDVQLDYGYTVALPNAAADAPLKGAPHDTGFVAYLRLAFQWGGFPGWADHENRPEQDLALLRDGLLQV